jgi:hypothetical protein
MERFIPLVTIVIWFGLVFGGSYLINWLLVRSIIRRYYRFFVAPGVIVHELSHALGCLITGSPIVEINFWKASGGHVKHLQPTDPLRRFINDPIIALAPIWGTFAVLGILTWFVAPDIFRFITYPSWDTIASSIDFGAATTWLYLYLVTSLLATIAPSRTDMMYALASLAVLTLLLILLAFIPGFSDQLNWLISLLKPFAYFSLGIIVVAIVTAFILAIPASKYHFTPREAIE